MANKVQMHQQEISYSTFVKEVEAGNVTAADIRQNSAVPTGRVTLSLKDDSSVRSLNVSDVGSTAGDQRDFFQYTKTDDRQCAGLCNLSAV